MVKDGAKLQKIHVTAKYGELEDWIYSAIFAVVDMTHTYGGVDSILQIRIHMKAFLKVIAENYASRYPDLSSFRFVFPSKRSGTFFRKYLAESIGGRSMIAPDITTVSDLAEELSGRIVDSRVDLLLTLYDAYCDLQRRDGIDDSALTSFDSFRPWGDVVLSDFNDIDLYCADASEVFKNVRDFREIETDFLSDEQREVMEEYFGVPAYREGFDSFWRAYDYEADGDDKRHTEVKQRFLRLWQTLGPLYEEFCRRLDKEGLTYTGQAYKLALERVRKAGPSILGCDRIVFIGFNALSRVEWLFFRELKRHWRDAGLGDEPFADFFWDWTSAPLQDATCSASRFISRDVRQFPEPEWADMECADASDIFPEIKVIASPSNSLQAKIAGQEIGYLEKVLSSFEFSDARVAVVLPDENLLLPMLYSLPENGMDINLTMGFSLRQTSAASFVQLLRRLQIHSRVSGGENVFLAKDVIALCSHPFMLAINGQEPVMRLKGYVARLRKFTVAAEEVTRQCPKSTFVFSCLDRRSSYRETARYLLSVLKLCSEALRRHKGVSELKRTRLDLDYIDVCSDAVRRMETAVASHDIDMDYGTFFMLTDRLMAGETVNFEGEPLTGLQIMGLLETRCLDFDHLIIPSMNERIFPRRLKAKSFIPASLRHAYGLSPAGYDESIFSYYFYRLISRAKTVTLIYDSRTGGLKSGEPSRYVQQLKYLYGKGKVSLEEYRFKMGKTGRRPLVFQKTPATMKILSEYLAGNGKSRFSASSIMKYLSCPLQFFFEKIHCVLPEEEIREGLDSIMTGNVVHHTLMELYLPADLRERFLKAGVRVTDAMIDSILDDQKRMLEVVRDNIKREIFSGEESAASRELPPDMELTAAVILRQVSDVMRRDRMLTPFLIHGLEFKEDIIFPLGDGRGVNFTCTIDRLDCLRPDSINPSVRIVDYKTGSVHAFASTPDEVVKASYHAKHLFQLQLYANLHNMWCETPYRPIEMAVYDVGNILKEGNTRAEGGVVVPRIGGERLTDHLSLTMGEMLFNDYFMEGLRSTLCDILDPEVPFSEAADEQTCVYCRFRDICGR